MKKEIFKLSGRAMIGRIETIYFGGGTPSLLTPEEIGILIDDIYWMFMVEGEPEITLEVNPDDFTWDFAQQLRRQTKVNRLSIGVQSFLDKDLQVLGRRHDSYKALEAIRIAKEVGFSNISIDFIYGIPNSVDPMESLRYNLEKFFELDLPHLSAYTLTIEPHTVLGRLFQNGELVPVDEELFAALFEFLVKTMEDHGFIHYEISNFARPGFISKHNFGYWTDRKYLGFGPAAHSYDGVYRYWNKPNIYQYIEALESGYLPSEKEKLTDRDIFNEYILTRLRTYLGISPSFLEKKFPQYYAQVKDMLLEYEKQNFIYRNKQGNFVLTMKGKLYADRITSDLFVLQKK